MTRNLYMKLPTPSDDIEAIEQLIASDQSPVGIDAKKTHIIIIRKLLEIEARLERMERTGER